MIRPVKLVFQPGQSRLSTSLQAKLSAWLREVRGHSPADEIAVSGYTAAYGTPDTDLKLSLDRAKTVAAFLTAHGIPPRWLSVTGSHDPPTTEQIYNRTDHRHRLTCSVTFSRTCSATFSRRAGRPVLTGVALDGSLPGRLSAAVPRRRRLP